MDQDPTFEDGQQQDLECVTLGLAKNSETPDKEPTTTLAANIIGQMPPRERVFAPMHRTQIDVSSWPETCQSLSAAPIRPRDPTPYYGAPVGGANLAATVTISQAVTTKGYQSQPNFKLPYPPGRLVLPAAKERSQVRTDTAECQDILGNFYHRNREKVGPHPSFRTPEAWKPLLDILSCESLCRRSSMLEKEGVVSRIQVDPG